MKITLTGLLGTALISTALTGCPYGREDIPPVTPVQTQQQKEALKTIYTIENNDGSVIGYFNESNKANLQGLENAGRVEDYRINPITGEVYRLTDQSHQVIGLKQTETPFTETKPQEPDKQGEPEYITRQEFNRFSTDLVNTVEKVIDERFEAYFPEQHPQHQSAPKYQPQSNELPMVPIEPGFPQTQRPRIDIDIDIMKLPPARSNRR